MSVLPQLELVREDNLAAVVAAVDDDHIPYAGGTELVPAMRLGLRRPVAIVDLKRVAQLRSITVDAESQHCIIGAAVTHREISTHADLLRHLPVLTRAAARVGNARVRSTGTIGGNLCFAEPRSDLGCILVALGATCLVQSTEGEHELAIEDLLVGAFETALSSNEVLTTVVVPFEPPNMSYWKLQSFERPTLGVALIARGQAWEITVGAATERPTRVSVDQSDTTAVASFVDSIELSDDLSGSPDYKRSVLRSYLTDALAGAPS